MDDANHGRGSRRLRDKVRGVLNPNAARIEVSPNDIIVVEQPDATYWSYGWHTVHFFKDWSAETVRILINDVEVVSMSLNQLSSRYLDLPEELATKLTALKALGKEKNTISFILQNEEVKADIFLWSWEDKIVVTDLDGTITKSDTRGLLCCESPIHINWAHKGVAKLFSKIKENGYRILYLSARPKHFAESTRYYISNVSQLDEYGTEYKLPVGPLFISPHGWVRAIFRQGFHRQGRGFKTPALQEILDLFDSEEHFHAGFGNTSSDGKSYAKIGISVSHIFRISEEGLKIKNKDGSIHEEGYDGLYKVLDKCFPRVL